ncbi:hypothetical protein [Acinetobacter nectaris]|uniref:hypothetical protein n=1 Tax=Acinetobacter nectaris TaxID=1219382 RepID=UPI001F177A86|nr:hypothetical protein [Acinetobacter nectaris]MCF8999672.1 hypothetical protein [Acinetobacter nectaris]MCF9028293.1 hypothetical protein [Acinetobacter nectaris]
MQSITLSSKGKRDLLIERVYEEQYLDEVNNLAYELWIDSDTSEIIDPMLYSSLNNMQYGSCIDINTVEYCVTNIQEEVRHS